MSIVLLVMMVMTVVVVVTLPFTRDLKTVSTSDSTTLCYAPLHTLGTDGVSSSSPAIRIT